MARDVILVGDATQVRRVLALAGAQVPDGERRRWVGQLAGVAKKRLRAEGSAPAPRTDVSARLAIWWAALVVGVCAAFAGATVLLPPRHAGNEDPAVAMAVAVPASVAGAVLLGAIALLAVPPAVRRHRVAVACAVIAGAAAVAGAVFALIRRDTLVEAAGGAAYALWWVATVGILGAVALLIIRILRAGARPPHPEGPRPGALERDVRRSARDAADQLPYGPDVRHAWVASLDRSASDLDPRVRDQAERLGLFAYLAWAAYSGHVDAAELEALRR